MRHVPVALTVALLAGAASPVRATEPYVVDLIPVEKAEWTLRNVFAGLSTVVRGSSYWYADPEVAVETVPAGAQLALYYIRSNFQKRYERAQAPVHVRLPRRIHATSHDVMTVRAAAPGYLTAERRVRVLNPPERLVIELDPLPNALVFLGHTHLAGRSTLTLRTTEEPDVRVSRPRGARAFTIALTQTADRLGAPPSIAGGHVRELGVAQVGEDLLLRVEPTQHDIEVRSRAQYDPIRDEHILVLDLHAAGVRPPSVEAVRSELADVDLSRGQACADAFAASLREHIDAGALARAFRRAGSIAALYQREAMLRLGRLDHGRVETREGEVFRTGSDLELALALETAPTVRGYLALLGESARARPDPSGFLRALIAPELSDPDFTPIYAAAESACPHQGD